MFCPRDQYFWKKKTWKHFHLQLTAKICMADEAKKKQTGDFPGTHPAPAQACFVTDVKLCE